jgi:hypothetical protein
MKPPPEQIGGATYGATVLEQLDGRTLRIDLGPPKGSELRGVVVMHAVPATRFNLTAGVHQRTYVGSLDPHLGSGIPVAVRIVNSPRPRSSSVKSSYWPLRFADETLPHWRRSIA